MRVRCLCCPQFGQMTEASWQSLPNLPNTLISFRRRPDKIPTFQSFAPAEEKSSYSERVRDLNSLVKIIYSTQWMWRLHSSWPQPYSESRVWMRLRRILAKCRERLLRRRCGVHQIYPKIYLITSY